MATGVKVPRNFKLLGELDDVEHGGGVSESHIGFISFGLARPDDTFLTDWNASIIGPQNTPLGDRIFTLQVKCGENYPDEPPRIRFVNRINMEGVDQTTGEIAGDWVAVRWPEDGQLGSIGFILACIRDEMRGSSRFSQPPEGTCYPAEATLF
mmetsp:Transcript_8642/g.32537  ORF Transcript_8642/g.32537 Transcript_8642/m.32537 type:complete len:153 (-) Transcript_8642:99-557(-)